MRTSIITGYLALAVGTAAIAQVPAIINYQGRIAVGGTSVFDGPGQFKFALVNGGTNLNRTATGTPILSGSLLIAVTITDGGVGYLESPSIMISDPTGSNAVAKATITAGAVTEVVFSNPGRGYTAPTITFSPPPPNFAYETFWSNDGSSTAGSEPVLAVPSHVSQGAFSVNLGDTSLSGMTSVLAPAVLAHPDVRLRIWFNDGTSGFQQFYPDQRLTASPYAVFAGSVTEAAVGSAQLAPGAVGPPALAPGAVGSAALAFGSVGRSAIADNGVGTAKIEDGAITANKLAAETASLTKISGGAISADNSRVGVNRPLDVTGKVTATAFQGSGVVPWEVVGGASRQAVSNTGYVADNDAEVLVTLPATPAVGDVVRVSGKGSGGWKIAANNGQSILTTVHLQAGWTPRAPIEQWRSVASSADGARIVAAGYQSRIYISRDAGATWVQKGDVREWTDVMSSSDGVRLVAVSSGGGLQVSSDSGATWNPRSGVSGYSAIAQSGNGTTLVALSNSVTSTFTCTTSTNLGSTWTSHEIALQGEGSRTRSFRWLSVAASADGTRLTAIANAIRDQNDSCFVFVSVNAGIEWRMLTDSAANFSSIYAERGSVTISPDGTRIRAGAGGGTRSANSVPAWSAGRSDDSGATWIGASGDSGQFTDLAASADGTSLIASVRQGTLFVSKNSGTNWYPQENSRDWTSVSSSSDGTRIVAVVSNGQIWTMSASSMVMPIAVGSVSGDANAAIELQYVGDGKFRTLSREGNISY